MIQFDLCWSHLETYIFMISLVGSTPCCMIFSEEQLVLMLYVGFFRFDSLLFKRTSLVLMTLRRFDFHSFQQGVTKNWLLWRFLENILAMFYYFNMKSRYYIFLALDIKSLSINGLLFIRMRLKVVILASSAICNILYAAMFFSKWLDQYMKFEISYVKNVFRTSINSLICC